MIIVDGPDGGGKTWLIKDLSRQLQKWTENLKVREPVKVIHSPGPLESGLLEWALDALDRAIEPVIFDRFPYFSEAVYGPILRHKSLISEMGFQELGIKLMTHEPLIVYCRPPLSVLLKTSQVMNQMDGVIDNLKAIVKRYDQQLQYWMRDFRVFHYDFTQEDNKELLMTVIDESVREDYKRGGWKT